MDVGVFGQPGYSAAKWAGEGNTFAYLYEPEGGATSRTVWVQKFIDAGIRAFVLQDAVVASVANLIPRGGLLGIIPGAPDPTKGGQAVYDEPERSGVTPTAFRDFAQGVRNVPDLAPYPRWMNWQGDKITGGPDNLKPVPGFAPTDYNRQPYDVWTEQTEYVGLDWHVAARGYPVAHIVTAFDRMTVWAPGKRLFAMLERGPQTASDNPRYLTRTEILAQNAIVIAMGAWAVVGFYTREAYAPPTGGKPRPGGFNFDPRNDEQTQASRDANRVALRFDPPSAPYGFVDPKIIKDPNTARMVRDPIQGYIVKAVRTIDGGRTPITIEVNCSHVRGIKSDLDGVEIPPLGVRYNGAADLPPVAAPPVVVDPPPVVIPPAPDVPPGGGITVTREMWEAVGHAITKLAEGIQVAGEGLVQAAAEIEAAQSSADLANERLDKIASGAGRPPAAKFSHDLTSGGEDAVLRMLDKETDAGRPSVPSQDVPESDMTTVRRMRGEGV